MSQLQERLRRALRDRYAVERELGRGGMAVVYLASDLRHNRPVAVKVLKPELTESIGAERFLREIGISARLNHPRIVSLMDSGEADGLLFYVMPYIEGESLRARLDREKQLPIDEAIEITRQVAAALGHAHGHGIVHRDIKPANILLMDGEALVADFGVARAVTAAGGTTLTSSGVAVGTPTYMSPEQASGEQEPHPRGDIYALGSVLYEMLAGEPPFTGPTPQAVTARKLSESAPDVTVVREAVAPSVGEALRTALARVPADRFATADEFAAAIRRAASERTGPAAPTGVKRAGSVRDARVQRLAAGVAGAALVALAAWAWLRNDAGVVTGPIRMTTSLPSGVTMVHGPSIVAPSMALSPDGRTLIIAGTSAEGQQLYRRSLDRLEATPLRGTEGGSSPFFSPDGEWIGFVADGRLKRVPAEGGAAVDIVDLPGFLVGATWGRDRIVFAVGAAAQLRIASVASDADRSPGLDSIVGYRGYHHPELLPDGRTLLFDRNGAVHAVDLESGRSTVLVENAAQPRYASGHLVISRRTALFAAPFDPERVAVTGPFLPVVEGAVERMGNLRHYAVSRTGTLAYLPAARTHELVLRQPDGSDRLVTEERPSFQNPQFSPDGRQLAVATQQRPGEPTDIWIHQLDTEAAGRRLTFHGGRAPVWTADGSAVTYSHLGDRQGIYVKPADGRSETQQLLAIDRFHWLVGWTPDGRVLVYGQPEDPTEDWPSPSGIRAFESGESRQVVGPGDVWGGRLSPDGRWLAYYSRESGHFEVYVVPFPQGHPRWLISEGGDPGWGPDGMVLYYRTGDRLMAAQVDTVAGVRVLSRRLVVQPFSPPLFDDYDVRPETQEIVMVRPAGSEEKRDVIVVLNWVAELPVRK